MCLFIDCCISVSLLLQLFVYMCVSVPVLVSTGYFFHLCFCVMLAMGFPQVPDHFSDTDTQERKMCSLLLPVCAPPTYPHSVIPVCAPPTHPVSCLSIYPTYLPTQYHVSLWPTHPPVYLPFQCDVFCTPSTNPVSCLFIPNQPTQCYVCDPPVWYLIPTSLSSGSPFQRSYSYSYLAAWVLFFCCLCFPCSINLDSIPGISACG